METATVTRVREMGQGTSEADIVEAVQRDAAAKAAATKAAEDAAAAAEADEAPDSGSPETPSLMRRRTVSGGEVIHVVHPGRTAPAAAAAAGVGDRQQLSGPGAGWKSLGELTVTASTTNDDGTNQQLEMSRSRSATDGAISPYASRPLRTRAHAHTSPVPS